MKGDQKYFPVYANDGKLLPNFIFVANIESKDPQQIISGNEKVVRPRSQRMRSSSSIPTVKTSEDNLPRLQTVLFQQQLAVRDKTDRIWELSGWIAREIGADVNHATRAVCSPSDLMTNMVFEFTGHPGVMGMHYARTMAKRKTLAVALNEQYQPRLLAMNCRLTWLPVRSRLPIKWIPCGDSVSASIEDKDRSRLHRAAPGRAAYHRRELNLDLQTLTEEAVRLYGDKLTNANVVDDVIDFMLGRFRAWYQDEGYTVDTIQAVLARRPTRPADFDA